MTLFAGARTHSTIAALSSIVPTLSFGYSIKSRGINWDIFGHDDYCMVPKDLDEKLVSDQLLSMLEDRVAIKKDLNRIMPKVQKVALSAGTSLKQIVGAT